MAEGFFNALNPGVSMTAESAGVGAVDGTPPSLLAVLEMKRRKIDIARHRARNVSSVDIAGYGTVIALDREVAARFWAAYPECADLRTWTIPDPYGGSAGDYREAADLIRIRVEEFLRSIS
jgi:protein-tyrosine-phosphatase